MIKSVKVIIVMQAVLLSYSAHEERWTDLEN